MSYLVTGLDIFVNASPVALIAMVALAACAAICCLCVCMVKLALANRTADKEGNE